MIAHLDFDALCVSAVRLLHRKGAENAE